MSQDLSTPIKHIGLFRIRGGEHRDLILARCSSWFPVRREGDLTTEYVAISDQFEATEPGQFVPVYEWEIKYDRATAKRIPSL